MVTIATVLRSGGDFYPKHVVDLYMQVRQHATIPFRFVCLTDTPFRHMSITCVALREGWPGWWSKIELFDRFESAFYLDLDTVVVSDITDLLLPRDGFWALRDLYAPPTSRKMGSGLMSWGPGHRHIYDTFAAAPDRYMQRHKDPESWGDQGFIQGLVSPEFWQDHYPGRVVSYKKNVLRGEGLGNVSIVCFHGKPRPWDVAPTWRDQWQKRT